MIVYLEPVIAVGDGTGYRLPADAGRNGGQYPDTYPERFRKSSPNIDRLTSWPNYNFPLKALSRIDGIKASSGKARGT